jgi:hypothetical protein
MPVCMTFASIFLIGVVVVVFGMSNRSPADETAGAATGAQASGPAPPLWVFPVVLFLVFLVFFLIVLIWPDMWG